MDKRSGEERRHAVKGDCYVPQSVCLPLLMYQHYHSIYGVLAWLIYSTPPNVECTQQNGEDLQHTFSTANLSDQSLRVFLAILLLSKYDTYSCHILPHHPPAPSPYVQPSSLSFSANLSPPHKTHSLAHSPIFVGIVAASSSSNNITTYTIHQSFATLSLLSAPVNNDIFAKTPKGFIIPESSPSSPTPLVDVVVRNGLHPSL